MRLTVTALNLWLRLTVKRALQRAQDPVALRTRMERDAAQHMRIPNGAHFIADAIRRAGQPRAVGMIDALWASVGRPDRRKVILYLHGGAYIAGSIRTHKHLAAALAGAAGVRAVVPDYRLAPEHPFPAALEDALAAYRHLLAAGYQADEIAIAGDSAGGGLAFALSLALEAEALPPPACIVAFSPWADMTGAAPSLRRNAHRDAMLPARRLDDVVGMILGDRDRANPLISPVYGTWSAPPPALILASRSEILADDATGLAARLKSCGGDVHVELWRGLPHAWPIFRGRLHEADRAISGAGAFLARHLRVNLPGAPDAGPTNEKANEAA